MTTAANLHWNIFGFESWPQKTSNMWRDVKFTLWTKYLGRVDSYAKRTIQNLVCRFMFFLILFFWQIFHEDIFHWIFGQFLTSTSGAISFSFQMLSEWLVGWAESELLWDEGHHRTTHWGINTTSILTSCRYFYFSIFIRSLLVRGLIHHSLVRLSWSSLILSTSIQPFLWG